MGRIVARQTCARTEFILGRIMNKAKAPKSLRFEWRSLGRKQTRSQSGRKIRWPPAEGALVFGELRHARIMAGDGNLGANDDSPTRAGRVGPSACSDHRSEARRRANTAPAQRADRPDRADVRKSRDALKLRSREAFAESQDARTGTVGVYANSTSIATKTNTPLVNIPQSITVVTKDTFATRASRASPT